MEEISLTFYEKLLGDLWQGKKDQSLSFMKSFAENFNLSTIECIETGASQNLKDGCFGILLAKMCFETGGIFSSVDLSSSISSKSYDLYNEISMFFSLQDSDFDKVIVKWVENIIKMEVESIGVAPSSGYALSMPYYN